MDSKLDKSNSTCWKDGTFRQLFLPASLPLSLPSASLPPFLLLFFCLPSTLHPSLPLFSSLRPSFSSFCLPLPYLTLPYLPLHPSLPGPLSLSLPFKNLLHFLLLDKGICLQNVKREGKATFFFECARHLCVLIHIFTDCAWSSS